MENTSADRFSSTGDLDEALASCRSATTELVRAAQVFIERLEGAIVDPSGLERAALELQKVLVDEAHTRFVYTSGLLLQHSGQP